MGRWRAAYAHGHLTTRVIETISRDGQTLTDTLRAANHGDEKDVNVFEK
jgi:hypothetical protein